MRTVFPLTLTFFGIAHHLSGPSKCAQTQTSPKCQLATGARVPTTFVMLSGLACTLAHALDSLAHVSKTDQKLNCLVEHRHFAKSKQMCGPGRGPSAGRFLSRTLPSAGRFLSRTLSSKRHKWQHFTQRLQPALLRILTTRKIKFTSFPGASRPFNPLSKAPTHCRCMQDRAREGESERES